MKCRFLFFIISLLVASFPSQITPMEPASKQQRLQKKQNELRRQLAQRQQTNISIASKSLLPDQLNPLMENTLYNHSLTIDKDQNIPEKTLMFLDACAKGNYPEVYNYIVEQKIPVNSVDGRNITALEFACGNSRLNIAELLVNRGANINHKGAQGHTPLHQASMRGDSAMVEFLIGAGATVNVPDLQQKEFPLHFAASKGHIETVQILVDHHAEVDVKNNRNCTPLFFACKEGHLETVKFLVTSKAAINVVTLSGMTPLHIACYNGHTDIVYFLMQNGANMYAKNCERATPIDLARQSKHKAILIFFNQIDPSISVDIPQRDTEQLLIDSQLISACFQRNKDRIYELLEHPKLNINIKEPHSKQTPLHYACYENDVQLVKRYLHLGANTKLKNSLGFTPLHIACENGHEKIVALLLKAHANIEDQEFKLGARPLHYAADGKHFFVVKLLIEQGALVDGENINNATPLMVACQKNNNLNTIEYLLSKKAQVTKKDSMGLTALHIACARDVVPAIALLINYGSDIEAETHVNMTPLMVASQYGHPAIVKTLLSHGANLNKKNTKGLTSAHFAALLNHREVLRILLKAGADVTAETERGLSVLDFIYDKEDPAILKLLTECGIPTISEQEAQRAQQEFFAQLNKEEAQEKNPQQGKNYKRNQRKKEKKQRERITIIPNNTPEEPQENNIIQISSTTQTIHSTPEPIMPVPSVPSTPTPKSIKPQQPTKVMAVPIEPRGSIVTQATKPILMHEKFKWPKSLKGKQQQEMISKLKQLKNWPDTGGLDITNLKGNAGMFRLRVGNHRILFSVDQHAIKIHQIGLRKNVYKNI